MSIWYQNDRACLLIQNMNFETIQVKITKSALSGPPDY